MLFIKDCYKSFKTKETKLLLCHLFPLRNLFLNIFPSNFCERSNNSLKDKRKTVIETSLRVNKGDQITYDSLIHTLK